MPLDTHTHTHTHTSMHRTHARAHTQTPVLPWCSHHSQHHVLQSGTIRLRGWLHRSTPWRWPASALPSWTEFDDPRSLRTTESHISNTSSVHQLWNYIHGTHVRLVHIIHFQKLCLPHSSKPTPGHFTNFSSCGYINLLRLQLMACFWSFSLWSLASN